jgi:ribonuclease HI
MYYSIHKGFKNGIYNSWNECKIHVLGFKGAKYKKFNNKEDAEYYLIYGKENVIKENVIKKKVIKKKVIKKKDYNVMNKNNYKLGDIKNIKVYTDGSCHNNGCKNANAGIGIYFGENDKRNVSKKIIGKQTNNTAELKAILEVSKILHNEINNGDIIEICSDSDYAMKCCTTYGKKQELLDWKQNIPNKELVREIYNIYSKYSNVLFKHVKAHTSKMDIDSIGNRNADRLANESLL